MKTSGLLLFLVLLGSCVKDELTFEKLLPLPEPVTNNAVAAYTNGGDFHLYSFGGIDSTLDYSGIHLRSFHYSSVANKWERLPDLPDTMGKVASAASLIGDIIYIVGGYHVFEDGHEVSSNKVHRFHVPSNSFLEDASPLLLAIDDHVQDVWRDSLLFVITGWSNKRNAPATQVYFPHINSWAMGTPVPYNEEYMSFGASGAILNDTIFYTGGAQYEKFYPAQKFLRVGVVDSQNPLKVEWRIEPDNGKKAYRSAAFTMDNSIIWVGGSTVTYNYDGIAYESREPVAPSNQLMRYGPELKQWSSLHNTLIPMDLRNVAVVGNSSFVIVGGIGKDLQVLSSVTRFDFND